LIETKGFFQQQIHPPSNERTGKSQNINDKQKQQQQQQE